LQQRYARRLKNEIYLLILYITNLEKGKKKK